MTKIIIWAMGEVVTFYISVPKNALFLFGNRIA
jgi:hypothetical protein